MTWRPHVIEALTVVAEKFDPQAEKALEKSAKKDKGDKVWVEVTSQPEKERNAWVGRATFFWKKDPGKEKHSQMISVPGPAKLSIKSKKLHVRPKEGEAYYYGDNADDKKKVDKEKVEPGGRFAEFKDQKLTMQDVLDQGASLKEALGHLKPSKYPAPDIDPANVTVDLTGDLDTKALLIWKDPKGRDQRAYTPEFHRRRAAKKWERVKHLDTRFDDAKTAFDGVFQNPERNQDERDAAAVLAIITETGLRPGRHSHLKKSGNRGISTLAVENVTIDGDKVKLAFIGKSNKENKAEIDSPELAEYLTARMKDKQPGDLLFDVGDGDLSPIMKEAGLGDFKPKDFRTLIATRKGAEALAALDAPPPPLPEKENAAKKLIRKKIKQASQIVADLINNTAAMAQKAYISPAIIESYVSRVGGNMAMLGASATKVSQVVASDKPTAEELWKTAKEITLPGADEEIEDMPESLEDEELDSDILPEELDGMSDDEKKATAAALRAAAEVLAARTVSVDQVKARMEAMSDKSKGATQQFDNLLRRLVLSLPEDKVGDTLNALYQWAVGRARWGYAEEKRLKAERDFQGGAFLGRKSYALEKMSHVLKNAALEALTGEEYAFKHPDVPEYREIDPVAP